MQNKNQPVVITRDGQNHRLYRIKAQDQVMGKFIILALVNRRMMFVVCAWEQPQIMVSVAKDEIPWMEAMLASLPAARPGAEEQLKAYLYPDADAGRLDLAGSLRSVAQVSSQQDTRYLAAIWNVFAPGSEEERIGTCPASVSGEPAAGSCLPIPQSV